MSDDDQFKVNCYCPVVKERLEKIRKRLLDRAGETFIKPADYFNAVEAIELLVDESESLKTMPEMLDAVVNLEKVMLLIDITPYRFPQERKKINNLILKIAKERVIL